MIHEKAFLRIINRTKSVDKRYTTTFNMNDRHAI